MDIKEQLKEISANLHLVNEGIQNEDNKELISNAVFMIVRNIDRIVEEIDKDSAFSNRL